MAMAQAPAAYPARSRRRQKDYVFALLAAAFVLACYLYTREGSGLRASSAPPKEVLPLPWSNDAVEAKPPSTLPDTNGIDTATSGSGSSPSSSPGGSSSSSSSSSSKTGSGISGTSSGNDGLTTSTTSSLAPDSPRAVIIESSITPNLIPLMLHFAAILGPSWGMTLFTLEATWVEPLSPAIQRLKRSGHLEVRFLPADTELTSSDAVSVFLTSPWLWQQVAAAKRILLFQSDSILCAKSQAAVEDFFAYDFVGAPIASVWGEGYNGGLSVRNPRMFLQIVQETNFATSGQKFEDQFFFSELRRRGAALPDEEVAKTFSVETVFYETPLGYHQPSRWQKQNMAAIEEWCPEVRMLIGRRAL